MKSVVSGGDEISRLTTIFGNTTTVVAIAVLNTFGNVDVFFLHAVACGSIVLFDNECSVYPVSRSVSKNHIQHLP